MFCQQGFNLYFYVILAGIQTIIFNGTLFQQVFKLSFSMARYSSRYLNYHFQWHNILTGIQNIIFNGTLFQQVFKLSFSMARYSSRYSNYQFQWHDILAGIQTIIFNGTLFQQEFRLSFLVACYSSKNSNLIQFFFKIVSNIFRLCTSSYCLENRTVLLLLMILIENIINNSHFTQCTLNKCRSKSNEPIFTGFILIKD